MAPTIQETPTGLSGKFNWPVRATGLLATVALADEESTGGGGFTHPSEQPDCHEEPASSAEVVVNVLRRIGRARNEIANGSVAAANASLREAEILLLIAKAGVLSPDHVGSRRDPDATVTTDAGRTSMEDSLPLDAARRLVSAARDRVRSGDLSTAKAALDAAEDNVVFAGVFKKDPLSEANEALRHALHNHRRGATDATKAALRRAIGHLDYATNELDEKNRLLVPQLLDQAVTLDGIIGTDPSETKRGLADLHLRTRALCERSIEYFATAFDRIHLGNGFKADLIEAKLHLAFAQADRLTIGGDGVGKTELATASRHLVRAGTQVEGLVRSRIRSLHEALRPLAEPAKTDGLLFARLRRELCILIRT